MFYITDFKGLTFMKGLFSMVMVSCLITSSYAQQDTVRQDTIVQQFYTASHEPLYWFSSDKNRNKATR